jgi:hypothetical protein
VIGDALCPDVAGAFSDFGRVGSREGAPCTFPDAPSPQSARPICRGRRPARRQRGPLLSLWLRRAHVERERLAEAIRSLVKLDLVSRTRWRCVKGWSRSCGKVMPDRNIPQPRQSTCAGEGAPLIFALHLV